MKNYFNEEQIKDLNQKGISEKQIEEVNSTLKLYFKKVNRLDVKIDGQAICQLENIKDLMKERETYGIEHWSILRELVLKSLDRKYGNDAKFKGLFFSTIRAAAPDYMDMGGSQFYRIYINDEGIRICGLDNLFHFIESKEVPFSDVKECCLKEQVKVEGEEVNIYHEVVVLKDNPFPMYMYATKKMSESKMKEFHKILLEHGIKEKEVLETQIKNTAHLARYISYVVYAAIAVIIVKLTIMCFKVV